MNEYVDTSVILEKWRSGWIVTTVEPGQPKKEVVFPSEDKAKNYASEEKKRLGLGY